LDKYKGKKEVVFLGVDGEGGSPSQKETNIKKTRYETNKKKIHQLKSGGKCRTERPKDKGKEFHPKKKGENPNKGKTKSLVLIGGPNRGTTKAIGKKR